MTTCKLTANAIAAPVCLLSDAGWISCSLQPVGCAFTDFVASVLAHDSSRQAGRQVYRVTHSQKRQEI